ncbi:MAG: helix-turn-helix domain-containing protein [Promethearchaeota archaeon]|jgi:predicted transcriptional regulator
MENLREIKTEIEDILKSEPEIISIAVIEGENNVVFSSDNWDTDNDIERITTTWQELKSKRVVISEIEYIIIQSTPERFIAINMEIGGSIIGLKDEERRIICKLDVEGSLFLGLKEASQELRKRSSKEPYMDPQTTLGKTEELKWATPRILLDDTNNLQELGLLKFGLSLEEARVYLSLLRKGKEGDKVGNLNEDLDIKRTTIYRILDRLIDKEWVVKLPGMTKGAQIYIARPLNNILDERIQEKEEELKILKSFRFIMGDELANGWINMSEIDKDLQSFKRNVFGFKTLGVTGVEKDCGLLIFEYGGIVENNIVVQAALQLSSEKLKMGLQIDEDIEEFKNPDLDEVKFEFTEIRDYIGVIMYLKFKEGSETANNVGTDWVIATKQVAIPIKEKVYVIWGSDEKFPILLDIVLKIK